MGWAFVSQTLPKMLPVMWNLKINMILVFCSHNLDKMEMQVVRKLLFCFLTSFFLFLRKRKAFCSYCVFCFLKEHSQAFQLPASHFLERLLLCFCLKTVWSILTIVHSFFLSLPSLFLPLSEKKCHGTIIAVTQIYKLSGCRKPL